jgi:hypothetical protein
LKVIALGQIDFQKAPSGGAQLDGEKPGLVEERKQAGIIT